jgi:hypothetical protein
MSFANAVRGYAATPRTANGMKTNASTGNSVLDFFSTVGSARGMDLSQSFFSALEADKELAIRALLWSRDVREGAGERAQFRNILAKLDSRNPTVAGSIMHKIPELGRWDDLFSYTDPLNRRRALTMIQNALDEGNGLAAKWMPRKGPVAVELTRFLGLTPKQYRKKIVSLTNVVEQKMCSKEWDAINFSHLPSMASSRYQKAFGRNVPALYGKYIEELKKPVEQRAAGIKINADAIYPHTIVKNIYNGNADVANAQWEALPNYIGDNSILPIVDVSGSMGGVRYSYGNVLQPIEVAIALGLYTSGKNTGVFKDIFLTFSGRPEFVTVKGSLQNRVETMSRANWDMNTNLHAAFDAILNLATRNRVPSEDMPKMLLILSDMQFDQCVKYDDNAIEMIRRKYEQAGYNIPRVVFWNLNSAFKNAVVKMDTRGTAYVSGFSPSIMSAVLADELDDYTPYNVMLKKLMSPRYDV